MMSEMTPAKKCLHSKTQYWTVCSYDMQYSPIPFVRELCKHKSEDEIREAEDNFRRFLMLVKEVCEDMENCKEVDNTSETGHSGSITH